MLLLLFPASATDPAFECDALVTPSDGTAYRDRGWASDSVFDRLVAAIEAEFEPGCPSGCDTGGLGGECYRDDCVTSTGTHIEVDYLDQ